MSGRQGQRLLTSVLVCRTIAALRVHCVRWLGVERRAPERVQFEWNQEKADANLRDHRVSFEEARTVFGDPLATTVLDADSSQDEERWLTTGLSETGQLLIVWHTNRGDRIRIIGARRVTPQERRQYESGE